MYCFITSVFNIVIALSIILLQFPDFCNCLLQRVLQAPLLYSCTFIPQFKIIHHIITVKGNCRYNCAIILKAEQAFRLYILLQIPVSG